MKKLLLTLALIGILLSACGSTNPNDFPPAPPMATPEPAQAASPTAEPTQPADSVPADANLYTLAEGGFSMVIPAGWSVAGPMAMNGYNLYGFGADPANSGGPDSSQVIIADASALTMEQFAQQMCSVCPVNPVEEAIVGGLPAKRTLIGGGSAPAAVWYFVVHNGKLIGFSMRPAGDAPSDWIIGTVQFASSSNGAASSQWVAYWDGYYGYGLAIPCWWKINPTGDSGGALTMRSYDEAFFAANSSKGEWLNGLAPEGAVKLDVAMMDNVDPNVDTETIIRQSAPPEDEVSSLQEVDLNGHTALLVEFKNTMTAPVSYSRAYYLRFQPDKLLIFAAYPTERLASADVQAIIHSIAFSNAEAIYFPSAAPSVPLIPLPDSCPKP